MTGEQMAAALRDYMVPERPLRSEAADLIERQAAEIAALRAMLKQAEDDLERARTVIGRVRATVGDHNG